MSIKKIISVSSVSFKLERLLESKCQESSFIAMCPPEIQDGLRALASIKTLIESTTYLPIKQESSTFYRSVLSQLVLQVQTAISQFPDTLPAIIKEHSISKKLMAKLQIVKGKVLWNIVLDSSESRKSKPILKSENRGIKYESVYNSSKDVWEWMAKDNKPMEPRLSRYTLLKERESVILTVEDFVAFKNGGKRTGSSKITNVQGDGISKDISRERVSRNLVLKQGTRRLVNYKPKSEENKRQLFDVDSFHDLNLHLVKGDGFNGDHIPASSLLKLRYSQQYTPDSVHNQGIVIAIPADIHGAGDTHGSKSNCKHKGNCNCHDLAKHLYKAIIRDISTHVASLEKQDLLTIESIGALRKLYKSNIRLHGDDAWSLELDTYFVDLLKKWSS